MKEKKVSASFTVEAAFIMPIVILLTAWILHMAIALYIKVDDAASDITEVRAVDSLKLFRDKSKLEEVVENILK